VKQNKGRYVFKRICSFLISNTKDTRTGCANTKKKGIYRHTNLFKPYVLQRTLAPEPNREKWKRHQIFQDQVQTW